MVSIAVTGVIFGAAYFLWYYERSMLGPLGKAVKDSIRDLHPREILIASVLSVMILWIGLYPEDHHRQDRRNGALSRMESRSRSLSTLPSGPSIDRS